MNSRPYGELEEQLKALRAEAEAKKAKQAPEMPDSSQRYEGLRELDRLEAGRLDTVEKSRAQLQEITHGLPGAARIGGPMRVNSDKDRTEVRGAETDHRAAPPRRAEMQPTPGGTIFQARRPSLWDRPAATAASSQNEQEQSREASQTKRQTVWDQPPQGEMTGNKQEAQNREANREVTANRQRNPFAREASQDAQRLIDTIASRGNDGRGRG